MTTHRDWANAMLAEPDDDLVRLAFADWLEERGEGARAEWVRLSVAYAKAANHDEWEALHGPLLEASLACVPSYWKKMPKGVAASDRGMQRLRLDRHGIHWLNRARWMHQAVAEGWVGVVGMDPPGYWDTSSIDAIRNAWAGPGRNLALEFDMSRQLGALRDSERLLALPYLYQLDGVVARDVTPLALDLLRTHPGLRKLGLIVDKHDATIDATLDALGQMPNLRRLDVRSRQYSVGAWMYADNLLRLTANPGLRTLRLAGAWFQLPAAVREALQAARPGLFIEQLA